MSIVQIWFFPLVDSCHYGYVKRLGKKPLFLNPKPVSNLFHLHQFFLLIQEYQNQNQH